ncbi:DUF4921 family protein [Corynebacterium sp. 3HC-13]|uniref:DUF4921 family protein n=1 Tax=Corynebacterium poyangense TaxID=2684405 RepID=UPI001CCAAE5B|nr:DUF4921 family protein [Corynebacterium poyangense]MBZ8178091.1 DUF4921 family protein [Corynebacterium poyangense]
MTAPMNFRPNPLTTMADGTIKQVNPFSGTEVWTVPGRGNRPLARSIANPQPLDDDMRYRQDAFGSERPLDTPPEKARMVRIGDHWEILRGLLPDELASHPAEFRRVPNLFEIVSYDYWRENYQYSPDPETSARMERYLRDPAGKEHVKNIVRTRLKASGRHHDAETFKDNDLLALAPSYFAGGHDVIIARRHYVDDAVDSSQLASSGTLTQEEHAGFILFTVDAMRDLYERNRYAQYVVAFQNWLSPAGASFEHLHKQLVAIDEASVQAELEISRLRQNPNMYNEWGVDFAFQHNLVIAENDYGIVAAGVGHRYPTLTLYSRSETSEPWLQSEDEVRGMSDLIHACHAAAGPHVACNEEWHHRPPGLDLAMPWRINIKWRVSTLAGFEGGTKIYVNTLSPVDVRDKVVPELYRLRDEGHISQQIRIATECQAQRNPLRYNSLLRL